MTLPRISASTVNGLNRRKQVNAVVKMGQINYSDSFNEGDFAESKNISLRRYPYITTRNARELVSNNGVSSMAAWDKLITVRGTSLYYDNVKCTGTVTNTPKQFAMVNTKCVIWPDKVYLDLTDKTIKPLEWSNTLHATSVDGGAIFVTPGTFPTSKYKVGDVVFFTGVAGLKEDTGYEIKESLSGAVVLKNVNLGQTTVNYNFTIKNKIPDMDFICESENRLWGCSNADKTIYASALGEPTKMFDYKGLSTDSYAVAVGSDGEFTGCISLASSVLFFKEHCLHKILGSFPAEYALYTHTLEGLKKGCEKSMQVINDVLLYVGLHGVYAYSGGTPSLISSNFGNVDFTNAVGGNDGDTYYLSAKNNNTPTLLCYELTKHMWVCEDNLEVKNFARLGKQLYYLDDKGAIYLMDNGQVDPNIEWGFITKPFYETLAGRKIYSKMQIRMELPKGSNISVYVRYDNSTWEKISKVAGKTYDVVPIRFALHRCDKFDIKFEGKGPCTILGISRHYLVGSDM